eukprot:GHVH01013002.1.p1 GENE.GHVH01013002.1~~GHVH01013002.1.p1  ORF type:complete len:205 (+),score=19.03 GHVH01013002.1:217-831(+)
MDSPSTSKAEKTHMGEPFEPNEKEVCKCAVCQTADKRNIAGKQIWCPIREYGGKVKFEELLPPERCAMKPSYAWEVFASHGTVVRPAIDHNYLPGHGGTRRLRGSFYLPPGSEPFTGTGYSIRCNDPFVFPNPPRTCRDEPNLRHPPASAPLLWQDDIQDIDQMLWHRSEPRRERPYRIYADSKMCLKGHNHTGDIRRLMRPGW